MKKYEDHELFTPGQELPLLLFSSQLTSKALVSIVTACILQLFLLCLFCLKILYFIGAIDNFIISALLMIFFINILIKTKTIIRTYIHCSKHQVLFMHWQRKLKKW
uniref:Uncharacterized protein n=1 Tax=Octopus bimaculoides TaxID=37653 RepID=A0A0L8HS38_OCTBM